VEVSVPGRSRAEGKDEGKGVVVRLPPIPIMREIKIKEILITMVIAFSYGLLLWIGPKRSIN
jgi:hypothetical protein